MMSILMELRNGQAETNNKLSEVIASQTYLSEQYEDFRIKMEQVDVLRKKVDVLENILSQRDKELDSLKEQVRGNEQYQRRRQVEIYGVPVVSGENLTSVVQSIAKQVGVDVQPGDVDAAHRLPSRTKPEPIIVEFCTRTIRNMLLESKKKKTVKGPQGNFIQIHESLSPYFKNLLWKTKTAAREKNYKYVWFKKNKILVKKGDGADTVIEIVKESDLTKFCKQ